MKSTPITETNSLINQNVVPKVAVPIQGWDQKDKNPATVVPSMDKAEKRSTYSKEPGYWYSDEEMQLYGNYVIEREGYEAKNLIDYATEQDIFHSIEERVTKQGIKPLFILYNIGGISQASGSANSSGLHWITLCITAEANSNQYTVLLKDSMGSGEFVEAKSRLKSLITRCINITNWVENCHKEQDDSYSCGPMSITNMGIIAHELKTNSQGLIQCFEKYKGFCQAEKAHKLPDEYQKYLTGIEEAICKIAIGEERSIKSSDLVLNNVLKVLIANRNYILTQKVIDHLNQLCNHKFNDRSIEFSFKKRVILILEQIKSKNQSQESLVSINGCAGKCTSILHKIYEISKREVDEALKDRNNERIAQSLIKASLTFQCLVKVFEQVLPYDIVDGYFNLLFDSCYLNLQKKELLGSIINDLHHYQANIKLYDSQYSNEDGSLIIDMNRFAAELNSQVASYEQEIKPYKNLKLDFVIDEYLKRIKLDIQAQKSGHPDTIILGMIGYLNNKSSSDKRTGQLLELLASKQLAWSSKAQEQWEEIHKARGNLLSLASKQKDLLEQINRQEAEFEKINRKIEYLQKIENDSEKKQILEFEYIEIESESVVSKKYEEYFFSIVTEREKTSKKISELRQKLPKRVGSNFKDLKSSFEEYRKLYHDVIISETSEYTAMYKVLEAFITKHANGDYSELCLSLSDKLGIKIRVEQYLPLLFISSDDQVRKKVEELLKKQYAQDQSLIEKLFLAQKKYGVLNKKYRRISEKLEKLEAVLDKQEQRKILSIEGLDSRGVTEKQFAEYKNILSKDKAKLLLELDEISEKLEILQLLSLEDKVRCDQLEVKVEVFRIIRERVAEGKPVPISVFKLMAKSINDREVISTLVGLQGSLIPQFLLDAIKDFIKPKTGLTWTEWIKGKVLYLGQKANIASNELLQLSKILVQFGKYDKDYVKCISEIIHYTLTQKSTEVIVIDLALDLVLMLWQKGEEISAELKGAISGIDSTKAKKLLNYIDNKQQVIDVITDARAKPEDRDNALDSITSKDFDGQYIIDGLAALIRCDQNYRDKCFRKLIDILPDDYAKDGIKIKLNARDIRNIQYSFSDLRKLAFGIEFKEFTQLLADKLLDKSLDDKKKSSYVELLADLVKYYQAQDKASTILSEHGEFLVYIAGNLHQKSIRDKVLEILNTAAKSKDTITEAKFEALGKKLSILANKDKLLQLDNIEQILEIGAIANTEEVNYVLDALTQKSYLEKANKLLLKISECQDIPFDKFLGVISKDKSLLDYRTTLIVLNRVIDSKTRGVVLQTEIDRGKIRSLIPILGEKLLSLDKVDDQGTIILNILDLLADDNDLGEEVLKYLASNIKPRSEKFNLQENIESRNKLEKNIDELENLISICREISIDEKQQKELLALYKFEGKYKNFVQKVTDSLEKQYRELARFNEAIYAELAPRTLPLDILLKQIRYKDQCKGKSLYEQISTAVIQRLKQVAISKEYYSVQRNLAFGCLYREALLGKLDKGFLSAYYELFITNLNKGKHRIDIDTVYQELLKKFKSDKVKALNELYKTLRVICTRDNIPVDELMRGVDAPSFAKEYLIHDLLSKTVSNDGDTLRAHLYDQFITKVQELEAYIKVKQPKSTYDDLDTALMALIQKTATYSLDLESINSILVMLRADSRALKILSSNNDSWFEEIRELWLAKALEASGVIKSCMQVRDINVAKCASVVKNGVEVIEDILAKIDKNTASKELEELFEFLGQYPFTDNDISYALLKCPENVNKNKLQNQLTATFSIRMLSEVLADQQSLHYLSLNDSLISFSNNNWSIDAIIKLLNFIKENKSNQESLAKFVQGISQLAGYGIREYETNIRGENIFDILNIFKLRPIECGQEINKLAIGNIFSGSYEKGLEELLVEISKSNDESKVTYLKSLKSDYDRVIDSYNNSVVLESRICELNKNQIKIWSSQVRKGEIHPNIYEQLAVVKRAVELDSGFSPRMVQLLSVLTMLSPEEKKGRLAQVNTGEGKTTIVAMLAAIKILSGEKVDIVTSSPELARPQAEEKKSFFDIFGITVDHNSNGNQNAYKQDVVYGAASDFQGDILRDEYSKLGTRANRGFGVAIVDEVDSMLIDGKNHMVMLAGPMPAMEHLEPILAAIYIQITSVAQWIYERNSKEYIVSPEYRTSDGGVAIELTEEQEIPAEYGDKFGFIKQKTEVHLRKLFRDYGEYENSYLAGGGLSEEDKKSLQSSDANKKDQYPELLIPRHLREFILTTQLVKWIDSAIHARYRLAENKHYIVKGNKVLPVDAANTGIVQTNMNWSDGVHQFLQLKHGAKITAETVTTNYISNVEFFKRYGQKLYGLTGTLGSEEAKNLLSEVYIVDAVIIPPFKKKQYKELPPVICNDDAQWYQAIAQQVKTQLDLGRGVLVIAEYIKDVDQIRSGLQVAKHPVNKIKVYKTEKEAAVVKDILNPGEVIIATNIAGRGTDIKTSEAVEENGGLHVCVTFLPKNERVEQQNIGRTSRTGNKGTGQFVLNKRQLIETYGSFSSINDLKEQRNQRESQAIESGKTEIRKVVNKDQIFKVFCQLLDNVSEYDKRGIEERFGIWLKMNEKRLSNLQTTDDCIALFNQEFNADIQKEIQRSSGSAIRNPYYHVLEGNKLLKQGKYQQAISCFDRAITLDGTYVPEAHYSRGCAIIYEYGEAAQKEYDKWIPEAIKSFREARHILENNIIPMLDFVQMASNGKEVTGEQIKNKKAIYGVMLSAIEQAIGQGDDAKLEKRKERLEKQKAEITKSQVQCAAKVKQLKGVEKSIGGKRKGLVDNGLILPNAQLDDQQVESIFVEYLQDQVEIEKKYTEQLQSLDQQIKEVRKEIAGCKGESEEAASARELQEKKEIGSIGVAKRKNYGISIETLNIEDGLGEEVDKALYQDEITERSNNGLIGSIKISEIKPIDWWSVAGLALIGLCQVVGGAAMAVFSLGTATQFAMGFIAEGVSDLITAVKDGIINRSFDWAQWGIQKAISITVSIACAGMAALKEAAQMTVRAAKIATGAAQSAIGFTKEGLKLGAKLIGKELAKGVAKECVSQLVQLGINKILMPAIEQGIRKQLETPIIKALSKNDKVQELLKEDAKNRNRYWYKKLLDSLMAIINPSSKGESNAVLEGIKQYGIRVAKGVAQQKITGAREVMMLFEAGKAGVEITMILGKLDGAIKAKVDEVYQEFHKQHQKKLQEQEALEKVKILYAQKKLFKDIVKETRLKEAQVREYIETIQKELSTVSSNKAVGSSSAESRDYVQQHSGQGYTQVAPEVGEARALDLQQSEGTQCSHTSLQPRSPEELTGIMAQQFAGKITSIINNGVVTPFAQYGVSKGMDKLFAGLDKALEGELDKFQNKRRQVARTEDASRAKDADKWQKKQAEKAAKKSGKEELEPTEEELANAIVEDLDQYGEAGLHHLGPIADEIKRPIAICDKNGKIVAIIGKKYGGEPVMVQHQKSSGVGSSGHWVIPDGKGGVIDKSVGRNNNCLFDAIAYQTGKNPDELRQSTVAQIRTNPQLMQAQARDIQRFQHYMGGAVYDINDPLYYTEVDTSTEQYRRAEIAAKIINANPMKDAPIVGDIDFSGKVFPSGASAIPDRTPNVQGERYRSTNFQDKDQNPVIHGQLRRFNHEANTNQPAHNGRFTEYDISPTNNYRFGGQTADRGAHRLVRDNTTGKIFYTPNHYRDFFEMPLQGLNVKELSSISYNAVLKFFKSNINSFSCYFSQYTLGNISKILELRLNKQGLGRVIMLRGYIYQEGYTNIFQMFLELRHRTGNHILVPLSLYDKHAVGIMFVAQEDGSGYKAFYLDPENTAIPEGLSIIFKKNSYQIEQLPTEAQRYTNCGPEVIENFMLYLTGERLSQKDAIVYNSRLVEQELLSSGDSTEVKSLTLKDGCSKYETPTMASNALYNIQGSNGNYKIAQHTGENTITEQDISDGMIANMEPERTLNDLLIEVFSDTSNQTSDEGILGDAYSADY